MTTSDAITQNNYIYKRKFIKMIANMNKTKGCFDWSSQRGTIYSTMTTGDVIT